MLNKDINEIKQREANVLGFINARNKEKTNQLNRDKINSTPDMQMHQLNIEGNKGKGIALDAIFGKIFKNALPLEDPKRNESDIDVGHDFHQYVLGRTNGRGTEYYIREAIKKTNSPVLKGIMAAAESVQRDYAFENTANVGKINISDLNFKPESLHDGKIDDISDIIQKNVQQSIQDEKDKAEREEQYAKQIEDQLAADDSVVDDESLQEAVNNYYKSAKPKVYQPSLLEAVMLHKDKEMGDSPAEEVFREAVREYTMLNISKALKLESFNLASIKKMCNEYVAAE